MTEARRLLDAGDERERALLRAGAEEAPSDESIRAAARVLGLVPRAAMALSTFALLAKALKWSSLNAYVLAPIAIAGAMAGAYGVFGHNRHASEATANGTQPAKELVPESTESMGAALAEAPLSAASPDLRVADTAPTLAAKTKPSPASASAQHDPSSGALREQVALVDRARALVASGDAVAALRAVETYEHRFPRGALSEEAALLRIQATSLRGDHAAAAALAGNFRAAYPASVHTDKIRSLLGDRPN